MAKEEKEFDMFSLGFDGLIEWVERISKENKQKESQQNGKKRS